MDKLGQRLAAPGDPSPEDRLLLMQVLAAYDDVLAESERRVKAVVNAFTSSGGSSVGIATRVKTTGTIREKLARESGMGLKGMQDVAGIRITGNLSRAEQNTLGSAMLSEFSTSSRPPKLSDRRVTPSHGYRALHVIVSVRDIPVEIQIRTSEQDAWAQLIEKLGDVWGRGIRYGEAPPNPSKTAVGDISRARLVNILIRLSDDLENDSVADLEDEALADQLADLERSVSAVDERRDAIDSKAMLEEIEEIKSAVADRKRQRATRQEDLRVLFTSLTEAAEGWD